MTTNANTANTTNIPYERNGSIPINMIEEEYKDKQYEQYDDNYHYDYDEELGWVSHVQEDTLSWTILRQQYRDAKTMMQAPEWNN